MSITKLEIREITGKIHVKSGLHIGAGQDEIKIGGIDNPVVKNPINNQPYIPGSSLKGKIRSLLEWKEAKFDTKEGKPYSVSSGDGDFITRIFGNGKTEDKYTGGPTRAIFHDCNLANAEELISKNALTEQKVEVSINRISGTAARSGPRHVERVPTGAIFDFKLSFMIMNDTDENDLPYLFVGMKLLELTALGGSGSRGYGKIEFTFDEKAYKSFKDFIKETKVNDKPTYQLKELSEMNVK